MVDGAAILMAAFYGLRAGGKWNDQRGTNMLDGGAISTIRTRPPTANGFPLDRSNPSFTHYC